MAAVQVVLPFRVIRIYNATLVDRILASRWDFVERVVPQSTRCHLPNVEIYGGAKSDWHSTDLGDNPLDFRRNVIWH